MKSRLLPWIGSVALLVSVITPVTAHDDQHGPGWHGQSLADELAEQFLADSQPAADLEAQSSTACTDGVAAGYPCSNVDLMAFLPLDDIGGGKGNDIWGWTDASGREFAIMGRSTGTSFVEISDPENPVYLGNLPTTRFSSTWRDIKVYQNHAFIVSEAMRHGMQVFDLTRLSSVTGTPVTFSEDAHYSGFSTAHNLVINEASGFAYAVGTNTCSGGLHMVDIRNPLNPTQAGCFSGDGYTHDAQCVIYAGPDLAHADKEICFASNEDSVTIVDVSNKSAPVQLAKVSYPGVEYTHQGWLTDDQRYFLVDDELDEDRNGHNTHTYVFDLSDVDAPLLIHTFEGTTTAIDHNQYIVGNHSYQSNYRAGLRIIDITNKTDMEEVAFFDIYPQDDNSDFNGTWSNYPFFGSGMVVVSGIEQGLFVLRPNLGGDGGNTSPSVTLYQPEDGKTVSGTVPIEISATDVQDEAGTLTVEWTVDGGAWQSATYNSGTGKYEASWDSTGVTDGGHTVTARAIDSADGSATDSNAVTVDNVEDSSTMHVANLDGFSTSVGSTWTATVTITVVDANGSPVSSAAVTGDWSQGSGTSSSCTTDGNGQCDITIGSIHKRVASVTFSVTGITHGTLTYDATQNVETSITIAKP